MRKEDKAEFDRSVNSGFYYIRTSYALSCFPIVSSLALFRVGIIGDDSDHGNPVTVHILLVFTAANYHDSCIRSDEIEDTQV
jgi:hypothetical protein